VPDLIIKLKQSIADGHLQDILKEIVIQSKVEFNYNEDIFSDEDADLSDQED
jgi:hypothetical protein